MYSGLIRDIMKEWKEEARVKYIVLYRMKREGNDCNNAKYKLTLCTNHPGPFIGCGGSTIDKYREKIEQVVKNDVFIEFVETTDIV